MPSNFDNLVVTWYDNSDAYATSAVITNDVKTIPLFTDTGTGEVNEAKIVVRALSGNYIVSGNIVEIRDRFRIQVDDKNSQSYDRYFEVVNIIPSISKGEGSLLTLELLGIEYHTQLVNMSSPYWFEDAYTVIFDVAEFYNRLKGDNQPYLDNYNIVWNNTIGNGGAFYTANNYEYGLNEDKCYNRWMDVLEKLGASVSAGGTLQFYELSFNTTGVNAMDLRFRPSGDNTPTTTIINAKTIPTKNVGEQEGVEANPTGSHVVSWGSNEHGTLPYEYSKYFGEVEQFLFRPEWQTGVAYSVDARIKVNDPAGDGSVKPQHYKCTTAHTSGASTLPEQGASWATYWAEIDYNEEFGDSVQYSPWTDDKARLWSNNGADPLRSTFTYGAWFDQNIVIRTEEFFRTWADIIITVADTDDATNGLGGFDGTDGYSYEVGDTNYFPNGFRVLVANNSPTGTLAGFAHCIVEYRRLSPTNYTWRKLYSFEDTSQDNSQVVILHDGKMYEFTQSTTSWASIDNQQYGNECIHPYSEAPSNVAGFDVVNQSNVLTEVSKVTDNTNFPHITKDGTAYSSLNKDSAVRFRADAADVTEAAISWATGDNEWYSSNIGFNMRFPFPHNKSGGIGENIGQLYGGGGAVSWATSTAYVRGDKVINGSSWYICIKNHTSGTFSTDLNTNKYWLLYFPEPSVLDVQNMRYARDGQVGWNTDQCMDLGQINGVAFWMKYQQDLDSSSEHTFRAWFMDTKDHVVYQDFTVIEDYWTDVWLPIQNFKIYRGVKPHNGIIDAALNNILPPKELEVLDIFEWRNVIMFGVQMQGQYDAWGRFDPVGATIDNDNASVTWGNLTGAQRTIDMDGFRFTKPLVAHSGEEFTYNIEPEFLQRPNITNFKQLENDAKSQLEIEKFRHREYVIESSGDDIFDVNFGDSFLLENPEVVWVPVAERNGNEAANKIQLVAKRIEYSITKPESGGGGLRRKIKGSKVFT